MTFDEALTAVPFTTRGTDATGFLPPIVRAQGHLSLVLAVTADEEDESMTDEQLLDELNQAGAHWAEIRVPEAVSTATGETINTLRNLIFATREAWIDWDRETRVKNIRDVANRIVGFTAALDRELVGLTDSDAGSQL